MVRAQAYDPISGSDPSSSSASRGASRDRSGVTPSVAVTSAGRQPKERSAGKGTGPGPASPKSPDFLTRCALKDVPAVTLVVPPMIQPTIDNLLCRAEGEVIGTQYCFDYKEGVQILIG